jgi:type IV pilus assembly protein PilM
MKINAFGLDIGTTSMKVVWLEEEKKQVKVLAALQAPTPAKGMQSESPFDQEEMAQAIRNLVTDAKINTKYVHVALADSQVFTKVVEMPVLSEKELASAIYWEAEQYIPAPLPTMTLDWKVLRKEQKDKEQKMQVMLVGAQTALIQRYKNIIELAGYSIVTMETEILSVLRAIVSSDAFPTTLLIHIGALSTSLAIIQKGIIVFTYSIPLGGIAINRAIASDFGFSVTQAEEYKKIYGISDESLGGKIGKAIEPILMSMLTEVKKAIAFYAEKYKEDSQIHQVILSGGSAKLPGIDVFFVQNTNIETVLANPWRAQNIQNVPPPALESAQAFTIGVGLALKDDE